MSQISKVIMAAAFMSGTASAGGVRAGDIVTDTFTKWTSTLDVHIHAEVKTFLESIAQVLEVGHDANVSKISVLS